MVGLPLFAIMNCVISQRHVCHDVAVDSPLQPISGESIPPTTAINGDDDQEDIHARGFWGR